METIVGVHTNNVHDNIKKLVRRLQSIVSRVDSGFYYSVHVYLGKNYQAREYIFNIHLFDHMSDNMIKATIREQIITSGDKVALSKWNDRYELISYERKEAYEYGV